jgi:hypothetical protein
MCDYAPNREAAMVPIANTRGHCDPCLAPYVQALNDAGLDTLASCCGHGRRPGSIMMRSGQVLLILADRDEFGRVDGLWPGINDEPATRSVIEVGS